MIVRIRDWLLNALALAIIAAPLLGFWSYQLSQGPETPCGRVSTESGVLVSTSDRTSQSTLYWVPGPGCDRVTLYTGVADQWEKRRTAQISETLSGLTSGKNYDEFLYSCGPILVCIGHGPAWSSDTARGTGAGTTELTTQNGALVNANDISGLCAAKRCLYVATFRSISISATEDSSSKRLLWNAYHQAKRSLIKNDSTATWTYGSTTIRQANGSSANQVEIVSGISSSPVFINIFIAASPTGDACVMVGKDSITAIASDSQNGYTNMPSNLSLLVASLRDYSGLGYHKYTWLEATTSGTVTFYGNDTTYRGNSGIQGDLFN